MVDNNSNIDLVFRNGLKEFEVHPPEDMWCQIEPSVRKASRINIYARAAAFAGLIVAVSVLTYYFSHSPADSLNGPAITLNQDSRPEGSLYPSIKPAGSVVRVKELQAGIQQESLTEASANNYSSVQDNYNPNRIFSGNSIRGTSFTAGNNGARLDNHLAASAIIIPAYDNKGFSYETPDHEVTSAPKNRWSIGAMVSPTYYSKFYTGATGAEKDLAGSENAALSYTGGISFAFKVNKRFTLQMGLYYNSLNQEIDGVKSYSGFATYNSMKGSDNFTVGTSNGTIVSRNNDIFLSNIKLGNKVTGMLSSDVFDPVKSGLSYIGSALFQNFDYLEVPFVVRYKFIDRALGMNLIGGISYNQLLDNSAYAVTGGNKLYVGSTDGMYPISLSSSLGLGMEYNISKKLSVNLEPTVKYYLTPLNGLAGSSVHPYTFGILSGFSWKF